MNYWGLKLVLQHIKIQSLVVKSFQELEVEKGKLEKGGKNKYIW